MAGGLYVPEVWWEKVLGDGAQPLALFDLWPAAKPG
jgi:hypothetical protein